MANLITLRHLWFRLSGLIELFEYRWNFEFHSPYIRCQTTKSKPTIVLLHLYVFIFLTEKQNNERKSYTLFCKRWEYSIPARKKNLSFNYILYKYICIFSYVYIYMCTNMFNFGEGEWSKKVLAPTPRFFSSLPLFTVYPCKGPLRILHPHGTPYK